jgi:sporulation and spore germination protein/immunoglobulin-like protein involved in spore germination
MFHRQSVAALLIIALVAGCAAPGASPSPAVSGPPSASLPSPTASPSPSPSVAATPAPTPIPTLKPATPSPTIAPPSPSLTPAPATTIVRAYFLLEDPFGGGEVVNEPTLVPVLRTVPESPATATAAMKALLAGPSAKERAAFPHIGTLIPAGSKLLGIEISRGLATVDLSAKFASLSHDDMWDGGAFSLRGRLAQVVYTLTQFTTVNRVNFKLEGKPVKVFTSDEVVLNGPVTRATYRNRYLPPIFVDRPAWGAALPNPGRVSGLANVDEAQFRMAVLDRKGKSLVDVPVVASCGTGCWGQFGVNLRYTVSIAQWGTLRVWDISEHSGRPVAVREYPVYLRPAP